MSKSNAKWAKSKGVVVTEADRVLVGLDVHKKQIHAAVRVNGQEVGTHVLPARPAAVEKFLASYRPGLKHVVYEAGPTGYGLARHLRSAGVPVDVIAPSKTPQAPGHAAAVQALTGHVGVGRTTALAFETEMYQPGRFSNERQVSAMLGLAPRVRQSGDRRREGPLLKAGRGRLRSLLVEAAWVWIQHDAEARKVYHRLVHNTGSAQKAIVGMARRLGLNLWRLLVKARAAA